MKETGTKEQQIAIDWLAQHGVYAKPYDDDATYVDALAVMSYRAIYGSIVRETEWQLVRCDLQSLRDWMGY